MAVVGWLGGWVTGWQEQLQERAAGNCCTLVRRSCCTPVPMHPPPPPPPTSTHRHPHPHIPRPQESADIPAVRKMLETAEKVLGYDLAAVCNEGPKEKLDDTVFSQVGG